jgi:hypothetical protein
MSVGTECMLVQYNAVCILDVYIECLLCVELENQVFNLYSFAIINAANILAVYICSVLLKYLA